MTLVTLARSGDREAFGVLLQRHYPSLLGLCLRLLGSQAEAQDVAQEAALSAWLKLHELREPTRFAAWLHAIAANLARMQLRRRRLLSLDALATERGLFTIWQAGLPAPDEVAAMRELHDTIVAALAALSPLNRDAVIGFYLQGYSYAELSALLGVPISTLKGRLFFGRRRLRDRLRPLLEEESGVRSQELEDRAHITNDSRHSRAAESGVRSQESEDPAHITSDSGYSRDQEYTMEDEFVAVTVDSIRISALTQHRVVVLQANETSSLPIWIGPTEADAIAMVLAGEQSVRPLTHDLALRLVETLQARVERVVITKITESTFFAEIALLSDTQRFVVDARPSDAIALAVRANAPIFVARAVLDAAGVNGDANVWQVEEQFLAEHPSTARVLIVDDTPETLDQLEQLLTLIEGVELVGRATNMADAFKLVGEQHPTIVLVDSVLGEEDGLLLAAQLTKLMPQLRVVMMGSQSDQELVSRAMLAGARWLLAKPFSADALQSAISALRLRMEGALADKFRP
ncbi:sigma-70 family RNA polymerase sigma factor [Candidatus Gracilibacteria bacterium]|nr:sigma-70 family RNA polymerase sigma factor [Candidatus Gracilibacteria bacterium]